MAKLTYLVLCILCIISYQDLHAAAWEAFPVASIEAEQGHPSVHNGLIVFHEYNTDYGDYDIWLADYQHEDGQVVNLSNLEGDDQLPVIFDDAIAWVNNVYGDWDIYVGRIEFTETDSEVDITVNDPLLLTDMELDQTEPAIYGNVLLYQSWYEDAEEEIADWDVWGVDLMQVDVLNAIDALDSLEYYEVAVLDYDQKKPALHRDRMVYQENYLWDLNPLGSWSVNGTDITRLDKTSVDPLFYLAYDEDQESPVISGDMIVWEQNMGTHWDILAADVSDPDNPDVISIAALPSNARYPAIDGHLILWQDDRNSLWDIYGYNLVTHEEFRVTDYQTGQTVFSNQTAPAISGNLAVWVDDVSGTPQIYAAYLEGAETTQCLGQPGDANGDCQVNLLDLAEISRNWLSCGLDYQSACQ